MKYKNIFGVEIMAGDKVCIANEKLHEVAPEYFPDIGIIGIVTVADDGSGLTKIRWPDESVKHPHSFAPSEWIAFVSRKG